MSFDQFRAASPVHAREAAAGDPLEFLIRSEPVREIKVGEFLFPEVIEQFRGAIDPRGETRRGAEDLDDRLERVRTRGGRRAVVGAPGIDQRVHLLEPAPGHEGQTGHLHVASRQLRRRVPAVILQERVAPACRDVVVGMALHVVIEPVGQLVGGVPGMPRLDPLEPAVGQTDAPQSVVLHIVDEFHRKDRAGASDGEDQDDPGAAHPIHQRIPRGGFEDVPPERIRVVPDRQVKARQPVPFEAPSFDEVTLQLLGQVPPEALALGRGPGVPGRTGKGVMYRGMLRRIMRVGNGRQQEFADPALPHGAPVDQFVADDEGGLRHAGQRRRHDQGFPGGQTADHKDLPERKHERDRPEYRPQPNGQFVPE